MSCANFTQLPRCAALRRACRIPTMGRGANDLRCALDVNENRTRMHNRAIVYARVCVIRMCAYMAPHCGCVWCGRRDADYAVHMRLRLVLSRMSLLWRAVLVDVITWRKGVCICMGEVPLSGIEFRVQGAGCRCKAS